MSKIIREILKLLWKLFKLVFWRWLKPMLGRILVVALLVLAVVGFVVAMTAC